MASSGLKCQYIAIIATFSSIFKILVHSNEFVSGRLMVTVFPKIRHFTRTSIKQGRVFVGSSPVVCGIETTGNHVAARDTGATAPKLMSCPKPLLRTRETIGRHKGTKVFSTRHVSWAQNIYTTMLLRPGLWADSLESRGRVLRNLDEGRRCLYPQYFM